MPTLARSSSTLTSRLVLSRTSERDVQLREVDVFLDGVLWTRMKYARTIQLDVPPGSHVLKVSNGVSKQELRFSTQAGEEIHFQAGQTLTNGGVVMLFFLQFAPYKVFIEELSREGGAFSLREFELEGEGQYL